MSRHRVKARNCTTQKISRDGLILKNETTGESQLVEKPLSSFNLKEKTVRKTFDPGGHQPQNKSKDQKKVHLKKILQCKSFQRYKAIQVESSHIEANSDHKLTSIAKSEELVSIVKSTLHHDTKNIVQIETEQPSIPIDDCCAEQPISFISKSTMSKTNTPPSSYFQVGNSLEKDSSSSKLYINNIEPTDLDHSPDPSLDETPKTTNTPIAQEQSSPSLLMTTSSTEKMQDEKTLFNPPNITVRHEKPNKLQFSHEEKTSDYAIPKKMAKLEKQIIEVENKLEKATSKVPTKKNLRKERVFDQQKEKAKTRLFFENQTKSQNHHLKGPLPLRPLTSGTNIILGNAHRKLFQVEHENISVKAAHRGEMVDCQPKLGQYFAELVSLNSDGDKYPSDP